MRLRVAAYSDSITSTIEGLCTEWAVEWMNECVGHQARQSVHFGEWSDQVG